jgi:hypothetical protein
MKYVPAYSVIELLICFAVCTRTLIYAMTISTHYTGSLVLFRPELDDHLYLYVQMSATQCVVCGAGPYLVDLSLNLKRKVLSKHGKVALAQG